MPHFINFKIMTRRLNHIKENELILITTDTRIFLILDKHSY